MTTYDLISTRFYSGVHMGWALPAMFIIGAVLAAYGEAVRGASGKRPEMLVLGILLFSFPAAVIVLNGAPAATYSSCIIILFLSGLRMFSALISPGSRDVFGIMRVKAVITMLAAITAVIAPQTATYAKMGSVASFYDMADSVIEGSTAGSGPLSPERLAQNDNLEMIWVGRDQNRHDRRMWMISSLSLGEFIWRGLNNGRLPGMTYEPDEWNLIDVLIPGYDGDGVRIMCEYDSGSLFRSGYVLRNRQSLSDAGIISYLHHACPETFTPPRGDVMSPEDHYRLVMSRSR